MLLSFIVLGRAVYIQRVQGEYWRSMSDSLHQKFVTLGAERGTIYSEDGEMLSTSVPYFDIYMDFGADGITSAKRDSGEADVVYEERARQTIFNGDYEGQQLTAAEYEARLAQADERYARLLELLSAALAQPERSLTSSGR